MDFITSSERPFVTLMDVPTSNIATIKGLVTFGDGNVKYDKNHCQKCKVAKEHTYFCERCHWAQCVPCDNANMELQWFETNGIEHPDNYLCGKCIKRITKGEPKPKSSASKGLTSSSLVSLNGTQ